MHKYNLSWQTTDAQFLEAVLLATGGEGGAPLQEVLLMADAVDGTVYTLREVEDTVEKLVAAGMLQIQKNKLMLTPAFMQAFESTEAVDNTQEAILALLETTTLSEQSVNEARAALKKYKPKNYYQQYLEQYG